MNRNIIFAGFGRSHGQHLVTNQDIRRLVQAGVLNVFDESKILSRKDYQEYAQETGLADPFFFWTEKVMGFCRRYHTDTFPSIEGRFSATSLDLAIEAVGMALRDASIDPEDIDLWIVSGTSHDPAPSLACLVKAHMVHAQNKKPALSISSGCGGFLIGLERASQAIKSDSRIRHAVVAHADTISHFLRRSDSYVPFVTFGDGAAAVVLSCTESSDAEGLIAVQSYQDPEMMDDLHVTRNRDLVMNASAVKSRAIFNMTAAGRAIMQEDGINPSEIDFFVPHQTGNAILSPVCRELGIVPDRLYTQVQLEYGNLSGASVPFALGLIDEKGLLTGGKIILSTIVGVGGDYGAFLYRVPMEKILRQPSTPFRVLANKTVVLTGASGYLGSHLAMALVDTGARLILQTTPGTPISEHTRHALSTAQTEYLVAEADFSSPSGASDLCAQIRELTQRVDYLVHVAAIPGPVAIAKDVASNDRINVDRVNHLAPEDLTLGLYDLMSGGGTVIFVGSVAEDFAPAGSAAYVASKRALHGFAQTFASEAARDTIRCLYYMPGLIDGGMADSLTDSMKTAALSAFQQPAMLPVVEVAQRIAKSFVQKKVAGVRDSFEGLLVVRRDGYSPR